MKRDWNWVNDDQPYRMTAAHGELHSFPYSGEINDKPAYEKRKVTPPEFARMSRVEIIRRPRRTVGSLIWGGKL